MKVLHIDIETYSSVDLKKSGLYKYVESEDFEILLFGYSYDEEDVTVVDLTQGEALPKYVLEDLTNASVIKMAHNAQFEYVCISDYFNLNLDITQWKDTMIMAYYLSLPGSLAGVSNVLNLENKKDSSGNMLINYFSKPCKPTRRNGMRSRNLPAHDPEKWQLYIDYNAQDVKAEREVYHKLSAYNIPDIIWEEWYLDIDINSRGVMLDDELISATLAIADRRREELMAEAMKLTGLDNPNSPKQLKDWISEVEGKEIASIAKSANLEVSSPKAKRMLEIRGELGKSSVAKYTAMQECMCADGRARGLLQYYGTHTGRWAGRLIQVQNLPRNYMKRLEETRTIVKSGDYDLIEMLYDNPMDILSQLIRTALIPTPGKKFIIMDYASIEARVIAWLAKEEWQIEVFRTTGKIYEATAAKLFNIPMDQVDRDLRNKGKVASLALGYQGAKGALLSMGALHAGLKEDELPGFVSKWRQANPRIVKLWHDVESAARSAINSKGYRFTLEQNRNITFFYAKGLLEITLPSGRSLTYPNAQISSGRMHYYGVGSNNKWTKIDIYGGMLVENIVQAIARDCLAHAINELDEKGYNIVFHVHDEIVIDADINQTLEDAIDIATRPIHWAADLYLTIEGFYSDYYMKD